MELQSVTVIFLPPNTTSRLQPQDAGIIAAFKRRYRRRQLEYALDVEEGTQKDIYKIDQLTATRWIKTCWREVPAECTLNYFRHTGLVPGRTTSRRSMREEEELVKILEQRVAALRVRDPMDIEDFICQAAEDENEMEVVSADDLPSDVINESLLASAQQDPEEVGECEDDEEAGPDDSSYQLQPMPLSAKADAVRSVIFLLSEHPDVEVNVLPGLRRLQGRLRDELQEERDTARKQTSIRSFFSTT